MSKDFGEKEQLYLGCECMGLDHVSCLVHFPLSESDKKSGEKKVAYYTVKVDNYFDRIIPPLRYFYSKYDWESYFYYNWFRRVWIASKYIFTPDYERPGGILNCFNIMEQDFSKMDVMLALISNDIDDKVNEKTELWLFDNRKFNIKFHIERVIPGHDDMSWELGWEPHFKHREIFGRIRWAFKYMFGLFCDEQGFEIYKAQAWRIRGMIKWVQENNKEENE